VDVSLITLVTLVTLVTLITFIMKRIGTGIALMTLSIPRLNMNALGMLPMHSYSGNAPNDLITLYDNPDNPGMFTLMITLLTLR